MAESAKKYGAVAVLVLPTVLLCDTAAGWLLGWRASGNIEMGIVCLLVAFFGVAFAAFAWPKIRLRLHAMSKELCLLVLMTAIAWGCIELGAHVLEQKAHRDKFPQANAAFHTRGPNLRRDMQPDPALVTGITGHSHYRTDEHGVRTMSSSGTSQTFRILCVGGSTTECTYLDDAETWAGRLMHTLNDGKSPGNVWVGNAGVSGFSTREHLKFIKESDLLTDIDLVIVQPGINDLWRYLAKEETVIDFGRFATNDRNASAPASTTWRPMWSRSRVIQLYHTLRADPPVVDEAQIEGVGGEEYRIRRARRAAATTVDTLPSLDAGLVSYRDRIRKIIETCRARDIEVVFTTQPVLWTDDLIPEVAARCWFGWLESGEYLSLGTLRRAMDAYNEALMMVCTEMHVACADLSSMNGNPEYFYDDCHFTEAGAVEVARLLESLNLR